MQMVLLQTALCVAQDHDDEGNVDGDTVNAYGGSFGAEGTVADTVRVLRFFGLEGAVMIALALYPLVLRVLLLTALLLLWILWS